MNYTRLLINRGAHFRYVASKVGDGVICTTRFGAIDLTRHIWTLASNRIERNLVDDIGGYGIMREHCTIEPLLEFLWKLDNQRELRITIQYVKDSNARTFICIQRGSHGWYALARISKPNDPMLLREFFSSRRAHDKEGYGFCASKGVPERVYNYRPELINREMVSDVYGRWLRWAERQIGYEALHIGAWEGIVNHGIGNKRVAVTGLRRSVESRILNRPLKAQSPLKSSTDTSPERVIQPPNSEEHVPDGLSLIEEAQWYRDGYERFAGDLLDQLRSDGKFVQARDLVEKIIVIVNDKPEALARNLMILGIIDENLAEYERAALAYRRVLVMEPQDKKAWYYAHNNLGYCLNQNKRFKEAEPYLRQAIEIQPTWYNAYKNLGVSLAGQGDYAQAAKLFIEATLLEPHDLRALDHLEELIHEHEVVCLQAPEIRADLERCRALVKRKIAGPEGVRRISPASTAELTGSPTGDSPQKTKTIAILDDDTEMLDFLGNELAKEGFEILTCNNKRTFWDEMPKLSVDLIISDVNSPGMNGLQFLVKMRQHKEWKDIPIVIVTGSGGERVILAKVYGAYEVFLKPFNFEELLAAVKKALIRI